ncbi:hypothetical protein PAMP_021779 [Pampus punctatissimus]
MGLSVWIEVQRKFFLYFLAHLHPSLKWRLKQRLSEQHRQKAAEADQLGAELEEERSRRRRLEAVVQEAVIILRHILKAPPPGNRLHPPGNRLRLRWRTRSEELRPQISEKLQSENIQLAAGRLSCRSLQIQACSSG